MANLYGVWAKWERAVEQLKALDGEILAFGKEPHAWTIVSHVNRERGHYVFRLDPAWKPRTIMRWGAIIGEIVHDFRSGLDQLVWQLVRLNGGSPDNGSFFPICAKEPEGGFVQTRRQWTDKRNRVRHGPLFGISDDALACIEACQPYKTNELVLLRLHDLWNTDKHRHLAPMHMIAERPNLRLTNAVVVDRVLDRFDGNTYVVEVTIIASDPGLDAHVDVDPHTPTDVAFSEGVPVIEGLQAVGKSIIHRILIPVGELFPDELGVGLP
jgi:hypothetical protein